MNCVFPEKIFIVAYYINHRLTDSIVPSSSHQSTQWNILQNSSQLVSYSCAPCGEKYCVIITMKIRNSDILVDQCVLSPTIE